jgi:S-adenosylmethionine decarboxylase
MSNYWGYHLVLDCAGLNPESIRDSQNIHNFAKQLVNDIDMVAYGEPQIVRFGHSGKEGYTLVQLIETSNICAHFVEEDNSVYLDVFSCKTFSNDIVIGLVKKYFDAQTVRVTYLTRQA